MVDNRVAEEGNTEAEGKAGWEEKRRWRGRGLEEGLVEEGKENSFYGERRAAGAVFRGSP